MKKHSSHKTIKKQEDKVENIYGVHFEYEDLYSRLLKVQKEQKRLEAKSPNIRVSSAESAKPKRDDSTKKNKIEELKKNTELSLNPGRIKEVKSPPSKKNKSKSIKKIDNNKVLSPRDNRKKAVNTLSIKKKIDKTLTNTSKLAKKVSSSLIKKSS